MPVPHLWCIPTAKANPLKSRAVATHGSKELLVVMIDCGWASGTGTVVGGG